MVRHVVNCFACRAMSPCWCEVDKGAFDAVTVYDGVNRTLVHNCQMNADMVNMFVKHESFPCDTAFTEASRNPSAEPLGLSLCRCSYGDTIVRLVSGL